MRTITVDERRRRLAQRHRLHPDHRPISIPAVAESQVGLHSSDPTTPFLALHSRIKETTVSQIEDSLYGSDDDPPQLFRMLGMRRTLFAIPQSLVSPFYQGCAKALAVKERQRLLGYITEEGFTEQPAEFLDRVADATLLAIRERGEATAKQLREEVPELKETLTFGVGKKWGGKVGISTRILFLLAAEAKIVRGRPVGSWLSGQYRWKPMETHFGEGLAAVGVEEARRQLLTGWLSSYGPGTETDLAWWSGWTKTQMRETLSQLEVEKVRLEDDTEAWVLSGDTEETEPQSPWVSFLPSLDPTIMGYKDRYWLIGPHVNQLFDRNGNAGPTVWYNGRAIGAWSQTPDAKVVYAILENIKPDVRKMVKQQAEELEDWLDGTRIRPRFNSPLSKRLA